MGREAGFRLFCLPQPDRKVKTGGNNDTMATTMLDLDGVATDWVGNFYPWLCAKEGWAPTEWLIWHHYRNHGMSDADFVARLNEYAEAGGFGSQVPNDGIAAAVLTLVILGHSVHVVTDRPEAAHADTAWWVNEYIPDYTSLTISRDKTVFMEYGDGPYFAIDDRIENVEKMLEAGINAFLLTRPWNKDADLPRVDTLLEYVSRVAHCQAVAA